MHREFINFCKRCLLLLDKFAECHRMLNGKIEFDDERVERFCKI